MARGWCKWLSAAILTAASSPALATDPQMEAVLAELARLRAQVDAQQQQLNRQQALLQNQHNGTVTMASAADGAAIPVVPPASAPPAAPPATLPAAGGGKPSAPLEEAPAPPLEETALKGGALLPQGRLVLEPSVDYVYQSSRLVQISGYTVIPAVLVGSLDLQQSTRNQVITSGTVRYGITDRLEVDTRLPFVAGWENTTTRPLNTGSSGDTSYSASGSGLGDVEFGVHYQLNQGNAHWPILVGNLRTKTPTGTSSFAVAHDPNTGLETSMPTGTGFWTFEPSLTMIYPSDPAVFYGNVSYQYSPSHNFSGYGTISPGDAYGVGFGMGLALNDISSVSLGGDLQIVGAPTQNGSSVAGANSQYIGRGLLGYSFRLSPDTSLALSLAFGLTPDAPNMQLTVKVPLAFDLLK